MAIVITRIITTINVGNMIPIEIIVASTPMLKEELSPDIVVVLDTPSTFNVGVTVITELEMVIAELVGITAETSVLI